MLFLFVIFGLHYKTYLLSILTSSPQYSLPQHVWLLQSEDAFKMVISGQRTNSILYIECNKGRKGEDRAGRSSSRSWTSSVQHCFFTKLSPKLHCIEIWSICMKLQKYSIKHLLHLLILLSEAVWQSPKNSCVLKR